MRGTLANSFPLSEWWRESAAHSAKRDSPEGIPFESGWTIHALAKKFLSPGAGSFRLIL
jgi:hypothetical protein